MVCLQLSGRGDLNCGAGRNILNWGEVNPIRRRPTNLRAKMSSSTFRDFFSLVAELVLSEAEGGHPCRRKRETHRGFHIQ